MSRRGGTAPGSPARFRASACISVSIAATTSARRSAGGRFALAGGISSFFSSATTCSAWRKSSTSFAVVSNRVRSSSPLFFSGLWHRTQ